MMSRGPVQQWLALQVVSGPRHTEPDSLYVLSDLGDTYGGRKYSAIT
jgi:hypothetical protein